jgi:hypothetical protein
LRRQANSLFTVEQRTHHQITGEPMKFLSLADWAGMVETELSVHHASSKSTT